MKKQHVYR